MITSTRKDNYKTLRSKFLELQSLYQSKVEEVDTLGDRIQELEESYYQDSDSSDEEWDNCDTLQSRLNERNQAFGVTSQRLGEAKKANSALETRINELTCSNSKLETEISEKISHIILWEKAFNQLNARIQSLTQANNDLRKHNKKLKKTISEQKEEINRLRHDSDNLEDPSCTNSYYSPSLLYQKPLVSSKSSLYSQLSDLLVCPISLEMLKDPVIAPSGNTMERDMMQGLIDRGENDPFTRKGRCAHIIPNYLVKQIIELVNQNIY